MPPASLGGGRQRLPLDRGDTTDADTDTRPMYGCVLTITTPWRSVGGNTGYVKLTWTRAGTFPPMWTWKTHGIN